MTKQAQLISLKRGCNDALYKQLWHACAGSLVSVPFVGEQVYYFPQGHIEQELGVPVYPELEQQMPLSDLPSKILCKVIKVDLQAADRETDEVCAVISLRPEPDQMKVPCPNPELLKPPERCMVHSFEKTLADSDLDNHSTLYIPQGLAKSCLPPLDMSQKSPCQKLVAKDLRGKEWQFQHIYKSRHLLRTGWREFVGSKKLAKATGSVLIFLRGENGELRIGVRKPMGQETDVVKHGESICSGIRSNACYAMKEATNFCVTYRPRTIRSEFIVSVNKYVEAQKRSLFNKMSFMMKFEDEKGCEKSFNGTIEDFQKNRSSRWPDSEWRSVKVQWEDQPSSILLPDRVSPWELEPLVATSPLNSQPVRRNKRARPSVLPAPTPDLSALGMCKHPTESPAFSCGDSQRGRDLSPSPNFSTAAEAKSLGFSGNSPSPAVSPKSMHWVASVKDSLVPVINKDSGERKQSTGTGYRLLRTDLPNNSNVEHPWSFPRTSGMVDDCPIMSLDDESGRLSEPSNVNRSEIPSIRFEPQKSLTSASAEYPILPEIHTLDVLSGDSPVFPTSQGERVEYSRQYSLDAFYEHFYGFPVLQTYVSDLERICCIEGKFWENSMFQRPPVISTLLEGLGLALALTLKGRTWKSLCPDELRTIIHSIEDALNAGFKVGCLNPVAEKARAALGSFDTRCRCKALEKEKSSLKTRLQNVTCELQNLGIELRSSTERLDLESKCSAGIFD